MSEIDRSPTGFRGHLGARSGLFLPGTKHNLVSSEAVVLVHSPNQINARRVAPGNDRSSIHSLTALISNSADTFSVSESNAAGTAYQSSTGTMYLDNISLR